MTRQAATSPRMVRGTWAMKMARHPNASTIGPPATTPSTGAPAPTIDQNPSALTRCSLGKMRLMMANEAGPVAAPSTAPSTRKAMSDPALHATALAAAMHAAPNRPHR